MRPTDFIACVLKLLQLQPEMEIFKYYIEQPHEKYLTAVALFYLRLVGSAEDIYKTLEPFLLDRRKLRKRMPGNNQVCGLM